MSKKAKVQKSLEELLEEALVPEEEQPYEVPGNWVYFKFTSILDIQGGTQPPKSKFIDEEHEGYVRLVQIRDFASDKYKTFVPDTPKLRKIEEEDILIARYGASIGRILTGLSGSYNVALAKVVFPTEEIYPRYIFWLLKSQHFQVPLMGISRSAQSGFNKNDLSYFKMPLPPINEQKRIADKVERLLNKIDEAKQLIDAAKETFELRRAAILDKAFRGEYSKNTKDVDLIDHPNISHEIPYYWNYINVEDLCELISDCPHSTPKYIEDGEYPAIRTSDVHFGTIEISNAKRVSEKDYLERIKRTVPQKDDVIYCREGTVGNAGIITDERVCLAQRVVLLRPNKEKVLPKYFVYVLNSSVMLRQVFSNISQTTSPRINISTLKKLSLPIAPIELQQNIVNIIEKCLEKEQKSSLFLQEEHLEGLKQAILAKAFRGELGTNDPTEESSVELLKEVLKEKLN